MVENTVPSLLVLGLPNMEVQQPSEGAIGSCDTIPIWAMVVEDDFGRIVKCRSIDKGLQLSQGGQSDGDVVEYVLRL
jgi:hypothetical protein